MRVLVTGSAGFIGRNLRAALATRPGVAVVGYDRADAPTALDAALQETDVIFHLAGVNRPQHDDEFAAGNAVSTVQICDRLRELHRHPLLVLTSSTQATLANPYGASKLAAEEATAAYARDTGAGAVVFRLTNVFGKWSRPNYNSAIATFCHNIARDLPVVISDPSRELRLVYIDDVVTALVDCLDRPPAGFERRQALPEHVIRLGSLVDTLRGFHASRTSLMLPDFSEPFVRKLYATYISNLPPDAFSYPLAQRVDSRGVLAEFIKQPNAGQIFVSRTKPGITRGNHYHNTKVEKFFVIEGEALVRFRRIDGADIIEVPVRGDEFRVVDIPPGYTHSITNTGQSELIVLFWSDEMFEPAAPDTTALEVQSQARR